MPVKLKPVGYQSRIIDTRIQETRSYVARIK